MYISLKKISLSDMLENIVEKEKMLVTSIFSFSHNVFKKLYLDCRSGVKTGNNKVKE